MSTSPWITPLPPAQVATTLAAGLIAAVLLGGGADYIATTALWAKAIGPLDARPEAPGWSEFLNHPEQMESGIRAHQADLCAWLTRENLRDPSALTAARRDATCPKRP